MKKIIFLYFLLSGCSLFAQSLSPYVVNSGGGYEQKGDFQLRYSVGEAAILAQSAGDKFLCQGFLCRIAQHLSPINELVVLSGITISPNPTSDLLNITFTEPSVEKVTLELLDLQGRVLQRIETNKESTTNMDVSTLPNQMYLLKIQDAVHTFYKKVIKE